MTNISLKELFFIIFKTNSITFGGGYTIIPILREEFSINRSIISEDEMMDLIAIAQSVPGAMAINTSILIGYRTHGLVGAILSTIAGTLPCLVIITIISYFYQAFKTNFYINAALTGMAGMISAILLLTVVDLAKGALKHKPVFSVFIMLAAFILSYFVEIKTGLIILLCALLGISYSLLLEKGRR